MERFEKEIKNIDPDVQDYIFKKGYKAGNEHNTPSPETLTRLAKMGEDITTLKVGQGRVEVKLDNIICTLEKHIEEETNYRKQQDEFHKQIMESKANVWVEKTLVWIGGIIGSAIVLALLSLIIIEK